MVQTHDESKTNAGLRAVRSIGYVFILCDDIEKMKEFYQRLFRFEVEEETPGQMIEFRVGDLLLGLRPRGRRYDGPEVPTPSATVQLSFRVPPADVDLAHQALLAQNIEVIEGPTNQHWPHRTVYFKDPENNVLEIYADIHPREMRAAPTGVHAIIDA